MADQPKLKITTMRIGFGIASSDNKEGKDSFGIKKVGLLLKFP